MTVMQKEADYKFNEAELVNLLFNFYSRGRKDELIKQKLSNSSWWTRVRDPFEEEYLMTDWIARVKAELSELPIRSSGTVIYGQPDWAALCSTDDEDRVIPETVKGIVEQMQYLATEHYKLTKDLDEERKKKDKEILAYKRAERKRKKQLTILIQI